MHEAAIVASLIGILERQAALHGVTSIRRVNLKVGQLRAVDPQALTACFAAFREETVAVRADLAIEHVPVRCRCSHCGTESEIERFHFRCSACQSDDLVILQGEELFIESFEPE